MLHNDSRYSVYFGNARDSFYKENYKDVSSNRHILFYEPFKTIAHQQNLDALILLHQTHSTIGHTITAENLESYAPFFCEGDYMMTNVPHIGLGIMTADCLPVVAYDVRTHAVLALHAGWRGALDLIVPKAVEHFCATFKTTVDSMRFLFGPSAHGCCYLVGKEFLQHPEIQAHYDTVITSDNGTFYFNLPKYVHGQLLRCGAQADAVSQEFGVCTLENKQFCSHRRQGAQNAQRNVTIITLK